MQFTGALVKADEKTVAIAVVSNTFLELSPEEKAKQMKEYASAWPGVPFVLMLQDETGYSEFYGRPDLIALVAEVPLTYITWKTFFTKETE